MNLDLDLDLSDDESNTRCSPTVPYLSKKGGELRSRVVVVWWCGDDSAASWLLDADIVGFVLYTKYLI